MVQGIADSTEDITSYVKMPKLLFSRKRIYDLRDLIENVKRPRRIDIVLNRKKQKKDIQCILVQEKKDDSYPSKLKSQEDNKIQPTLENILQDKKSSAAFRAFLRSEFSEENMEFWLVCKGFRENTSPEELSWKAEDIYQEFLHPKAHREINVDHHIRAKIKSSLEKPSLSCFDEAQRHVFQLMEKDSCPRFLRSDAYLSLRRKTRARTMWYI